MFNFRDCMIMAREILVVEFLASHFLSCRGDILGFHQYGVENGRG